MRTRHANPFLSGRSAVEGNGASGAKGVAPGAGQDEPDPDWQPI